MLPDFKSASITPRPGLPRLESARVHVILDPEDGCMKASRSLAKEYKHCIYLLSVLLYDAPAK
jgi:hypothetical protein